MFFHHSTLLMHLKCIILSERSQQLHAISFHLYDILEKKVKKTIDWFPWKLEKLISKYAGLSFNQEQMEPFAEAPGVGEWEEKGMWELALGNMFSLESVRAALSPKDEEGKKSFYFSFRIWEGHNNGLKILHFCLLVVYKENDRYFKPCDKGNQTGLFLKNMVSAKCGCHGNYLW